jgi:F0F1-type ATP synthase alpha subunit
MQSQRARVKQVAGTLTTAYDQGQTKEAYLRTDELEDALAELERMLDPGHEAALAQAVEEAWSAARNVADEVASAEETLQKRTEELAKIESDLQDYQDNRRAKIEEALEEKSETEETEEPETEPAPGA